jgi:hypothetical protein
VLILKHIISFSTGLSSALTVERVINRYGKSAVEIVFMDTKIEDGDNYRFMDDCRRRWNMPITTLAEGRTPYQVFADQSIIANQKIAPCTFRLKIEPFVAYLETISDPVTIHIGYDFSEIHRCEATTKNYNARGWDVDYPLLWKPIEYRKYADVVRYDWCIEPPRMYALGYTHANCGGVCVKQGQGDWLRTLINYPERYAEIENWETAMRDHPVRKNYAIDRDQSGGNVSPLPLTELRERYEASLGIDLCELDTESACVSCGVGDLSHPHLTKIALDRASRPDRPRRFAASQFNMPGIFANPPGK